MHQPYELLVHATLPWDSSNREEALTQFRDAVATLGDGLDLTRLTKIIIADDFGADVLGLQRAHGMKESGSTNDPDYGTAVGKTHLYWQDGEPFVAVVLDSRVFLSLYTPETYRAGIYAVRHELGHVHDETVKSRAFGYEERLGSASNLQHLLRVHADAIWSEYIACHTSAPFWWMYDQYPAHLYNVVAAVEGRLRRKISEYRLSHDIDTLWRTVQEECSVALKQAATLIGSLRGLPSEDIHEVVPKLVPECGFREAWLALDSALQKAHASYPNWTSIEVLDGIGEVVLGTWRALGVRPEQRAEHLYIGVPRGYEPGRFAPSEEVQE